MRLMPYRAKMEAYMNELKGKLNGLSLFTGYAGIDLALRDYVRPVGYCDIEQFSHATLLSRFDDGSLPFAPIWTDVRKLDGTKFRGLVDVVAGGFPCQDLSVAGKGKGLAGERSGLFREIIRIAQESSPAFIFIDNVPAIRTRGSLQVQEALATIGYDTRWCTLSASEVGANHRRERWFCLAYSQSSYDRLRDSRENTGQVQQSGECIGTQDVPDSNGTRLQETRAELCSARPLKHGALHSEWWASEPNVGRVANGVAFRVDRIKALGNGVVPLQVKTAFETLMGIS